MTVKTIQAKMWHLVFRPDAEEIQANSFYKDLKMNAANFGLMFDHINNELEDKPLKHMAVIVHDKDTYNDSGEVKPAHIHAFIECSKRVSIAQIASVFHLPKQNFKVGKKGRYAKDNILAYLIHAAQPQKHQYDVHEVWCDGCDVKNGVWYDNGWYHKYVTHDKLNKWHVAGAKNKKQDIQLTLDSVIDKILKGEIVKENLLLTNELQILYVNNKQKIDNALAVAQELHAMRIEKDVNDGYINIKPVFVTGLSGSGKSHMVKVLVSRLQQEINSDITAYYAQGNNPLDGYSGEDVLVLDDFPAEGFQIKDWLHILDPHSISTGDARYKNKKVVSEYIFITSTQTPEEYFNQVLKNVQNEPLTQIIRRIYKVLKVIPQGTPEQIEKGDYDRSKTQVEISDHYTDTGDYYQYELLPHVPVKYDDAVDEFIEDAKEELGEIETKKLQNQEIENNQK